MSIRLPNGLILIAPEPDGICQQCGKEDELRPYGPNGQRICFDCAQKDPEGTRRRMDQILFGEGGTQ